MKTIGSSSISLAAAIAALILLDASHASAQQTPTGTFHSRSVTLDLTASGQARFSTSFGPLEVASFTLSGDTISLRDESGPAACASGPGRYVWHLDAESIRFQLVEDDCAGRRVSLAQPWMRGGAITSAAELTRVVITAQRQDEDVQIAPVSITVLSSAELRDARVTQAQDLTYITPGLQVGSLGGNAPLLFMRGVGNFAGNSLQDPTVTFNFDGVYIARPTAVGGLFYDLERVEVLKGPQGTLYGRNATGGAVNILPRRPVLGVLAGEMTAEYGENQSARVDGALNVPLGDRAALRVAVQRVVHGAYMHDGTDDQNDVAGRLSFRYDVSDSLRFRVSGDYFDQGGRGAGATPLDLGVGDRAGVSSAEGGAYYQTKAVTIAGRTWLPIPGLERIDNQHWGVSATMDRRMALGNLTVIAASRGSRLDVIGSPAGNLLTVQEHSLQNSIEARLASAPSSRLQTLLGAFYFNERITTPDGGIYRPYNEFNFSLQEPRSGVTSVATFARVTLHVTDRLRATLGARYTHENKYFGGSFESFQKLCVPVPAAKCPNAQPFPVDIATDPITIAKDSASAFNPADGTLTQGFRILADQTATFSRTTWRSAFEYDLSGRALLYTSYETGFKSGGFFFSNDSPVYQPEYVGAFTLGLKSRALDDRLQANLELFDWQYHDQQVSALSVDSKGATNLRTSNIGRSTIRGVEADVEYTPLRNTRLSVDVQYLSAFYDTYAFHTSTKPVTGCTVSVIHAAPPSDFLVDCSGHRAPYAPEWTHALEVEQLFPLAHGETFAALARLHHQTVTLAGLDFLTQEQQPGFWSLDASLTFSTADKRRSVSVFGQNVTNRTVISNTFVVPFSTFAVASLRPPRTIGVRVTARM